MWDRLRHDRLLLVKVVTLAAWAFSLVVLARTGFTRDLFGDRIGTDHIAFYSAARLMLEGRGDKVYDYDFLSSYQPALTGHASPYLDAYRNPPFYALFYWTTAWLPYLVSFWIWTAVSLAMLWFGLGWLKSADRCSACILALSFYPVCSCFGFGQNSLLSFGFFCLTFHFLDRKRFELAGLASGMLLYKPQLLLGLGLWWLLNCRTYGRCLLGLLLAGLFWTAVSFLVLPVETRLFIDKLKDIAGYDAFMFWNLCNPRGFGTLIAWDNKRVGNAFGAICSAIGIVCFVWFQRRHRDRPAVMFAAAVFLTLWASPHTMIYEWTLALVPAVLLWERVQAKRAAWLPLFAVSWLGLLINTPLAKFLWEWTKYEDPPGLVHAWAILVGVPVMAGVAIWAIRTLHDLPGAQQGKSNNC